MTLRQHQASWDEGLADGMAGEPAKYLAGLDALTYASGYVKGKARRREIDAVNERSAGKVLLFWNKRKRWRPAIVHGPLARDGRGA
jgi:hypothetical protein